MDRLVLYLISDTPHLPYLVASLRSLQQVYSGPIRVYAYPESFGLVQEIANDGRTFFDPYLWEPVYRGKNGQGLNRIVLAQNLAGQAEVVAYLDADTLPVGNLDGLFAAGAAAGYAATQFCDWVCNTGSARNRVGWMLDRGTIDQDAVRYALTHPIPSVNCGVFACRPESPLLPLWETWNREVLDLFIADEVTQHAITALHYLHGRDDITVLDGRWNSSPKYKAKNLPDSEVKIWHFHGDSCLRQNKSPKGVYLWWSEYRKCLEENLGGCAVWQSRCGNKYLENLLRQINTGVCLYCGKDGKDGHATNCPEHVG